MLLRFSRRAEADLRKTAAFIARTRPAGALSFVQEVRRHCCRLLAFPEAAPLRPELGHGVRLSLFGKYLVLYVVHADFIEIRRIVHGARAPAAPPRAPASGEACRRRRTGPQPSAGEASRRDFDPDAGQALEFTLKS